MVRPYDVDRRGFVRGASSLIATPAIAGLVPLPAFAQGPPISGPPDPWRELLAISGDAQKLGLRLPPTATVRGSGGFEVTMPGTLDLIDQLETAKAQQTLPAAEIDALIDKASDLLQRINAAERSPSQDRDETSRAAATARPSFESIKDEYIQLFKTCQIRDQYRGQAEDYANRVMEPKNREQYTAAADVPCCPWYFVGIIHALEASFNFKAHLHNGDPLSKKTVQVPKGRPPVWNPPNDWVSSAVDALQYDGFANQDDWSLARMLYRWESYNGFRSRTNYKINTPYLWSFSNHYTKGKFVADNVWDANAVSKQCGAAVILKVLVERGVVTVA